MQKRSELYLRLLKYGLLSIRHAAFGGKSKYCEIESDHLHNIPTLVNESSAHPHNYYFKNERILYLDRIRNLDEREMPEGDFHKITLQHYQEIWAELDKTIEKSSDSN